MPTENYLHVLLAWVGLYNIVCIWHTGLSHILPASFNPMVMIRVRHRTPGKQAVGSSNSSHVTLLPNAITQP